MSLGGISVLLFVMTTALLLQSTTSLRTGDRSCVGRCGEPFERGVPCSCDFDCTKFKQCCRDFRRACTSESSCRGRCEEPFRRGRRCHCDSTCVEFGECCPDHGEFCTDKTPEEDYDYSEVSPAKSLPVQLAQAPSQASPLEENVEKDQQGDQPPPHKKTPAGTDNKEQQAVALGDPIKPDKSGKETLPLKPPLGPIAPSLPALTPEPTIHTTQEPLTVTVPLETPNPTTQEPLTNYTVLTTLNPSTQEPLTNYTVLTTTPNPTTQEPLSNYTVLITTSNLTTQEPLTNYTVLTTTPNPTTQELLTNYTVLTTTPNTTTQEPLTNHTVLTTTSNPTTQEPLTNYTVLTTTPNPTTQELLTNYTVLATTPNTTTQEPLTNYTVLTTTPNPTTQEPLTNYTVLTTTPNPTTQEPLTNYTVLTTRSNPTTQELLTNYTVPTTNPNPTTKEPRTNYIMLTTTPNPTTQEPLTKPSTFLSTSIVASTWPAERVITRRPGKMTTDQSWHDNGSGEGSTYRPPIKQVPTVQTADGHRGGQVPVAKTEYVDGDICNERPVSGITTLPNGDTVVVKGPFFWNLRLRIAPQRVSTVWRVPSPIDSMFTRCGCQPKTYIFKGDRYWRLDNGVPDMGFPKLISQGFSGLQGPITAALPVPGEKWFPEHVFLFQGPTVAKYLFKKHECRASQERIHLQLRKRHAVDTRSSKSQVRFGSIHIHWKGFPLDYSSVFTRPMAPAVPTARISYRHFVVVKDSYYSLNMRSKQVSKKPEGSIRRDLSCP